MGENIIKRCSLETAKNRLKINGIKYLNDTKFVYDRVVNNNIDESLKKTIPIVNNNGKEVLRYKNLLSQYYWLINEFIPSCSYQKLCVRKNKLTWVPYKAYSNLRSDYSVKFIGLNNEVLSVITVVAGEKITNIPNSDVDGFNFRGWFTKEVGGELFDFEQSINKDITLYAQYSVKRYVVKFKYYDTSISNNIQIKSVSVEHGKDVDESKVPPTDKREGYDFVEWDGSYKNVTSNRTINCVYRIKTYIVEFFDYKNADEQDEGYKRISYDIVNYGGSVELPNEPIYEHYNFVEWVKDNGGVPDFNSVKDNIKVYPNITEKIYNVKFVDWDGSVLPVLIDGEYVEVQKVVYNQNAVKPTVVEEENHRENYIFSGWDGDTENISKDMTFIALYNGKPMLVTYIGPDGNEYASIEIRYGETAIRPYDPTIEDYAPETYGIFEEWCSDEELNNKYDFSSKITSPINIYAKFKGVVGNPFSVTFYNYDGTMVEGDGCVNPQYVVYGGSIDSEVIDTYIKPFVKEKEQYILLGWEPEVNNIINDTKVTTLFSDYQVFNVTFKNNKTDEVIGVIKVNEGSYIDKDSYPTFDDEGSPYVFKYWEINSAYVYDNMTIYGVFEERSFDIDFYDMNNNIIYNTSGLYGNKCETPNISVDNVFISDNDNPSILNEYAFNGLYYKVIDDAFNVSGETPEETVIDGRMRFKAQYDFVASSVTTYNIAYYSSESYYIGSEEVPYMTKLSRRDIMERGYKFTEEMQVNDSFMFIGFTDVDGILFDKEITISGDTNLYTTYMIKRPVAVLYDNINEDVINVQYLIDGETEVVKPSESEMPLIDGYRFTGEWYLDRECETTPFYFDEQGTGITGVVDIYAKYTGDTYMIQFSDNIIQPIEVVYDNPTEKPEDPQIDGYIFEGWFKDSELTEEFEFGKPLKEDITLYPKWTKIN